MNDRKRTTYRAERMGFVFQTFNLLPVLTAVETVELPLLVSGVRPGVARQRVCWPHWLMSHSRNRVQHRPAELLGGQRRRVTIARRWLISPRSFGPMSRQATLTARQAPTCSHLCVRSTV